MGYDLCLVKNLLTLSLMHYPTGHHVAAWYDPDTSPQENITHSHYIEPARAAGPRGLMFMVLKH